MSKIVIENLSDKELAGIVIKVFEEHWDIVKDFVAELASYVAAEVETEVIKKVNEVLAKGEGGTN